MFAANPITLSVWKECLKTVVIWSFAAVCIAGCSEAADVAQNDDLPQTPSPRPFTEMGTAPTSSSSPTKADTVEAPSEPELSPPRATMIDIDTNSSATTELKGVPEVLGFHIGGDNLCHGVDDSSGPRLDRVAEFHGPKRVSRLYSQGIVEVGWYPTFCTGTTGPTIVEVTTPSGETDRKKVADRFELTIGPRDPVGVYAIVVATNGQTVEQEVEVRHATRPILRAGRPDGPIDGAFPGNMSEPNEISLIGFAPNSDVPVGFYVERGEAFSATLVGLEQLRTDSVGRAVANISFESDYGPCVQVVAGIDDVTTSRPDDTYSVDGVTYMNFNHPRHDPVCQ